MTEKNVIDKKYEFVVSHFKDGTLLSNEGWRRFKLANRIPSIKRYIAAASVASAILVASASFYYYYAYNSQSPTEDIHLNPSEETKPTAEIKIVKIEFRNATLKEVIDEIEHVYDVKISNIPEQDIRITISYEGTAQDVVETINELLNTCHLYT